MGLLLTVGVGRIESRRARQSSLQDDGCAFSSDGGRLQLRHVPLDLLRAQLISSE